MCDPLLCDIKAIGARVCAMVTLDGAKVPIFIIAFFWIESGVLVDKAITVLERVHGCQPSRKFKGNPWSQLFALVLHAQTLQQFDRPVLVATLTSLDDGVEVDVQGATHEYAKFWGGSKGDDPAGKVEVNPEALKMTDKLQLVDVSRRRSTRNIEQRPAIM